MAHISVVIPVYKSENSLRELFSRLKESVGKITEDFEIIMVEDCGGDRSWDIILELSRQDRRVKGVQFSRNFGQHNALLCGIRAAKGKIIVTMDDDLQHPPEEIPKLIHKLLEGYDVVYGTPQRQQHGLWRNVASHLTKLALQSAMGAQTARHASAFRGFREELRSAFPNYQDPFVSIDVLLAWGTMHFAAVPVRHDPRRTGGSNYTFRKLLIQALNMMTGFSTLPLQIASLVGLVFTLFGLGVLFFVISKYLILGYGVPGFPFLASIIAIFSGVQLFTLGIIGEYLARIHFRTMGRPYSVIRKTTEQLLQRDENRP
jgi:undecaprenyl-phosphate 4-deoxy-4-formamido-L-arabinose transferase